MIAYLVLREGDKWSDVHRLTAGQVMSIGRAPTNRIVLRDDIASRHHCEVFQSNLVWTLRDLGSRNGTLINGRPVVGDVGLEPGNVIQIGTSFLAFTFDVSELLTKGNEDGEFESDTRTAQRRSEPPSSAHEIIERKRSSKYDNPAPNPTWARDRVSQELARLYKLALEMGSANDSKHLAEVVLDGLFEATPADIGGILLISPDGKPSGGKASTDAAQLTILACRTRSKHPYEKLSEYLSNTVIATREALLAHSVSDDPSLRERDSLGEIQAQSVICAPLRAGEHLYGLVHLYSTNGQKPLEADDLEFTLAVADQCGVALEGLHRQESLAAGLARMRDENQNLREQLGIESELVGASTPMLDINKKIARIAPTGATVLIRGESGVGKELVARAIHFSSPRRNGAFVCMNCAALSESLLESELFGHEKGSFTGAVARKAGKFEQAHGGTLMLDEVGEMSLSIQAKFLRVLEGHPFERVGGGQQIEADVRLVAATNRDLEEAVEAGTFRKDLYFRLHVVEMEVPPLREHLGDIPLLANHFLERFSRKTGRVVTEITSEALDRLMKYDWPGNVRELTHVIERAVILCAGERIEAEDIHLSRLGSMGTVAEAAIPSSAVVPQRQMSLDELEREYIIATLERTQGNKSQAALLLGIERSTLDRKLKRYNSMDKDE